MTVRFDLYNQRDLRGARFAEEWDNRLADASVKAKAEALATASANLFDPATNDLSPIRGELVTALKGATTVDQMATMIDAAAAKGAQAVVVAGANAARLSAFQSAKAAYEAAIDIAARTAVQKFSHAIEYSYLKPKNQPELSNIRYVGSGGFGVDEAWRATFNAAAEFYQQRPAGTKVGVFRDIQVSAQLDRIFHAKSAVNVTLSAAAYYQWMKERAIITITPGEVAPGTNILLAGQAPALLAPEGNIALGQVKLTLGVRDTKVKFPVSFTFANRTELIKPTKTVWGGQFGISYDFDSLFKP